MHPPHLPLWIRYCPMRQLTNVPFAADFKQYMPTLVSVAEWLARLTAV